MVAKVALCPAPSFAPTEVVSSQPLAVLPPSPAPSPARPSMDDYSQDRQPSMGFSEVPGEMALALRPEPAAPEASVAAPSEAITPKPTMAPTNELALAEPSAPPETPLPPKPTLALTNVVSNQAPDQSAAAQAEPLPPAGHVSPSHTAPRGSQTKSSPSNTCGAPKALVPNHNKQTEFLAEQL